MFSNVKALAFVSGLLRLAGPAFGYSLIDEFQVIGSNGSYIGDRSFSRGYVARIDPSFNGFSVNYQVPAGESGRIQIYSSDLLCHPSQHASNYTNPSYPMLQAQSGSCVAMKHLENGHVTMP
ncbi:hypothetical protein K470DRAFT_292244 [Piedraia hortae CBS 480.64]|uniref:DUF7492 domain-containing protein n=1 Tax=Piedraia hortae CBS 480.64 TaxID=1314780 RepID=A0A6A7C8W8_9PEZI|nr:hypothetical protein K470DRAFT_292244 [Piedraia hortae CBS 480.64]